MMKKVRTKKKIVIVLELIFVVLLCIALLILSRYQNTSTKRLPNRYAGNIAQVHSAIDYDGDGLDDQTDILQGALDYIATQPKYKSVYYNTATPMMNMAYVQMLWVMRLNRQVMI